MGVVFGTGWLPSTALQFAGLRVPIHLGTIRVEPGVLVQLWDDALVLQADFGLFYQAGSGSTLVYGGARAGLLHTRAGDVGQTSFRVGPALGAEHFLAERWSIGFETALAFLRVEGTDNFALDGNLLLRAYWN